MILATSVERLPDSIRQLILTQPSVALLSEHGQTLEAILGSPDWAAKWLRSAEYAQTETLKIILTRFAGIPFEMETILKTGDQATLTGADIRVAIARLRRSGILYAVRKAWGEQLLYLPTDCVALWQTLLFPMAGKPLADSEARGIAISTREFRLPLSLELLSAWHVIYNQPIPITPKGLLNRLSVSRMTAAMRLTAEDLADLSLTYPQNDLIPVQAALALDLGLYGKVLTKEKNEIRISETGLKEWLSFTPAEADLRLHDQIVSRYASAETGMHLAACAVNSLPISDWYYEEDIVINRGLGQSVDRWLSVLECFGWAERGTYLGRAVFRKKEQLDTLFSNVSKETEPFFVQPDGEIFVPPQTNLAMRWMLEEVAERTAADQLFVYRLNRNSCVRAFGAGFTQQSVTAFLEQGSGLALPEPCARALQDWFSPLGKVKLAEVVLLRTESSEMAALFKNDSELAEKLLEQVGERDFIVEASSCKFLREKLAKMGYPFVEQNSSTAPLSKSSEPTSEFDQDNEQGWIYRRYKLSVYEADRTLPNVDQLFPGIADIPATWFTKPRSYHVSTRKELIQRAIEWQVLVQIGQSGTSSRFIPFSLEEEGAKWLVTGQWRNSDSIGVQSTPENIVTVHADDIAEVMILLPSLEELESI